MTEKKERIVVENRDRTLMLVMNDLMFTPKTLYQDLKKMVGKDTQIIFSYLKKKKNVWHFIFSNVDD